DRGREPDIVVAPSPGFSEEAESRGLTVVHEPPYLPDPNGDPQRFILGAGVAVGDLDGDGWEDVIFANERRLVAFRNRPPSEADGKRATFEVATQTWGIAGEHTGALTCTLLFDADNDGDRDLFVGAHCGPSELWLNRLTESGRCHFELSTSSGITIDSQRAIAACAADFDGDGWPDLYVGCNEDPYFRAPSPLGVARNAQPDHLFLNNGNGTFRDVTEIADVGNTGWTLVTLASDYDRDGDIDIFVGNDFGIDVLYRNDGPGSDGIPRFSEVARESGLAEPIASMSGDWGDYDGDGDLDLFVAGMSSSTGWVIDHPQFPSPVPWVIDTLFRKRVRSEIRAFFHGNRFYENQGDGTFQEISLTSRTDNSQWGWGTCWLDFDNDGRLDLYGLNGFLSGPEPDDL
ncbi:MAG: VCBS repeat-containing protein, partial [Planctomycetes bacterium]|nr:VCBS repeat-containing protein [Planctomycetota bacterium]